MYYKNKYWSSHKSKWHFLQQLYVRYGLILEEGEYEQIIFKIKFNLTSIWKRDLLRRSQTHIVYLNRINRYIKVVYSLESELLITAVPFHHGTLMAKSPDIFVDGKLPVYQKILENA